MPNGHPSLKAQLFHRKPIAMLLEDAAFHEGGLKRALGALDLTALGIGAIIGAGIFVLTGVAAARLAGPSGNLILRGFGLRLCDGGTVLRGICRDDSRLGQRLFIFLRTMGELVGWIIGWDLILEYAVAAAAVAVGWSGYLNVVLRGMGIHLPVALTLALGSAPGAIINLPAFLIVLVMTAVLVVGISESARLNSIIVAIKLFAVGVVILVGVFLHPPGQLDPVCAVRMGRNHERRGGHFFRLHRLRRGLDSGGGGYRSAAQSAFGYHGLAADLHRALYPGRRGADRDDRLQDYRCQRSTGVGVRESGTELRLGDSSRWARWPD